MTIPPVGNKPILPLDSGENVKIEKLKKYIIDCFKISLEKLNAKGELSISDLIKISFELASDLFLQPTPITETQVQDVHLLFSFERETFQNVFNDIVVQESVDRDLIINPHPTQVFLDLNDFFARLPLNITYDQIIINVPDPPKESEGITEVSENQTPSENISSSGKRLLEKNMTPSNQEPPLKKTRLINDETLQQYRDNLLANYPIVRTTQLLGGNETVHQTFVLIGKEKKCLCIFKPTHLNKNGKVVAYREHTAWLVNYQHLFPVPLTILLEVRGVWGSAQMFITGSHSLQSIFYDLASRCMNEVEIGLQKIFIFDHLFINGDRHGDNILLTYDPLTGNQPVKLCQRVYAIDHDSCLQPMGDQGWKLDFQYVGESIRWRRGEKCVLKSVEKMTIDQTLYVLFSEEAVNFYERRMAIHLDVIPKEVIHVMKVIGQAFRGMKQHNIATIEKNIDNLLRLIQERKLISLEQMKDEYDRIEIEEVTVSSSEEEESKSE